MGSSQPEDLRMGGGEKDRGADAADGDVRQRAGEKDQTPVHHVWADDAAADRGQHDRRRARTIRKGLTAASAKNRDHWCSPWKKRSSESESRRPGSSSCTRPINPEGAVHVVADQGDVVAHHDNGQPIVELFEQPQELLLAVDVDTGCRLVEQ
jgi:hypothetical protein